MGLYIPFKLNLPEAAHREVCGGLLWTLTPLAVCFGGNVMRRRTKPSYKVFRLALMAGALAVTIFSAWRGTSTLASAPAPRPARQAPAGGNIYGPFEMVRNGHLVVTGQRTYHVGEIRQSCQQVKLP